MSSLCCPEGKQAQSRNRDVLRCRQAGLSPPAGVTVAQSHCRGSGRGSSLPRAPETFPRRPSRGGHRVCWGQDGAGPSLAPLSQCLAWALVPASLGLWVDLEWGGGLRCSPASFPHLPNGCGAGAASETSVRSEVRADGLSPRPSPPTGAPGGAHHLLGEPLPVPGGEQEVEEPLQPRAAQLRAGALREQSGEAPPQASRARPCASSASSQPPTLRSLMLHAPDS